MFLPHHYFEIATKTFVNMSGFALVT